MKVGIDLGGSHIAIGVVDENGRIIEKQERRILDKEKQEIKTFIEEYIIKNIKEMSKKYKITNIGIAIPGTVNKTSVIKSVNLNLENYNIVEALKKKINIPIKIKNDAKCAALAENKYGSLKDYKRSIFIGLGTGIGGAVIVDDKLLDTGDLPGCEIGHMIIQKDGLECKCGKKGCFEKYASMKAFKTNLRKELNLDEKTRGEELLNILRNNNENNKNYKKIEKVINDYIEYLSIGIYPEAHIWPYYTKIRPFKSVSFKYPVTLDKPSFCITNTYQSYGKNNDKVKIVSYIDGPFFPNKELTLNQAKQELRDQIYNAMCKRSENCNIEVIKYRQWDGDIV